MKLRKNGQAAFLRFIAPMLLALLPLLALGGGNSTAVASPPMPGSNAGSNGIAATDQTIVVRVYFTSPGQRDQLATELGAVESNTTGGYLTVFVDRDKYGSVTSNLTSNAVRWEIDKDQTYFANHVDAFFPKDWDGSPDTFFNGYRTVEENYAYMDTLVAAYPNLAEKIDIGDTWCKTHPSTCTQPDAWNGYDMYALHITNRSIPGPKPVFWLETGIHSREIAVPEMATRFMSLLLDQYNSNPDSHWLVDWHDIWVLPHVNPDGHHVAENGAATPRTQRKNADKDDGCIAYPPSDSSQFGTDNNRNFPFKWGCCGGSSGTPCNLTYRGPGSGSEEETMAVVNKIRTLVPDQRGPNDTDSAPITTTGVYNSMHSNAALNLFPWGWTTTNAPNDTDLRNIALHMNSSNAYPTGNGYLAGQPPEILYAVDGDTADWGYGELGIPAFTTEVGGSGFFPAFSTIDAMFNLNKGALTYQAKIARTPYLTTRGPDADTLVATPMTATQGTPIALTGRLHYNWTGSDDTGSRTNLYSQNTAAAEYYIDTPPWAGGTAIPLAASDGTFDSPTENVQGTVSTGALTPGRHILFIRGRGVTDYSGYQSWGPITGLFIDILPSGGPTSTPTNTPTNTATSQPTNTPTNTATNAPTNTPTTVLSATPAPTTGGCVPGERTFTLVNGVPIPNTPSICTPTATRTATRTPTGPVPTASSTRTPTRTPTGTIPTATRTNTATRTPTIAPTQTPGGPTATTVPSNTPTDTPTNIPTDTPGPSITPGEPTITPTPIECTLSFTDVAPDHTFYTYIQCLVCRNIISGYSTGCETGNPCFRPGNLVTRGQLAKIVSNSAGFNEAAGPQQFADVAPGSTFYDFVWRLADRGYISGYPCGGTGEPCGTPALPYFRPSANITRGQLSKIVANAANLTQTPGDQQYEDVAPGDTFYDYIWRLSSLGVINGYPCGSTAEPCGTPPLPYFRPGANATRGQASKIVANTFFPECQPTANR